MRGERFRIDGQGWACCNRRVGWVIGMSGLSSFSYRFSITSYRY